MCFLNREVLSIVSDFRMMFCFGNLWWYSGISVCMGFAAEFSVLKKNERLGDGSGGHSVCWANIKPQLGMLGISIKLC